MRRALIATVALLTIAATAGCTADAPSPSSAPTAKSAADSSIVRNGEHWVLYQRALGTAFGIRLVRPDGSGDHPLVSVAGKPTHPDWSPDGEQVVFTVGDKELWTVGVDGTKLDQLPVECDPDCYLLDGAAWAPDGKSIAYTHTTITNDVPRSSIESIELATGKRTTLYTSSHPFELLQEARWSPDGKSLVTDVVRYDNIDSSSPNGTTVGIIGVASARLRRLVDWKRFAVYPDFSPDGETVVFSTYDLGDRDAGNASDPYAASDLFTIGRDGTGLRQLTHNATGKQLVRNGTASGPLSSQPRWSPDGKTIVFVQVDGATWPGWKMASIASDGSGFGSATGATSMLGTHPVLRPVR